MCCSKQAWLSSLRPCNDLTTSLSIAQYNRRTKVKFLLNLTLTEGLWDKGVKYFLLWRSGWFLIYVLPKLFDLKVVYVWMPDLRRILFAKNMFLKLLSDVCRGADFKYSTVWAIISRSLYIFHPIFHWGLYCRLVSITDHLCIKIRLFK